MQNELGKIVSYVCFTFTSIVTTLANRSAFSIPNADAPEGWSRARILTGIRESGMLCANACKCFCAPLDSALTARNVLSIVV